MKTAHLSAPIERPQNIWQWFCLLTLVFLGWVSREQLGMMFAEVEAENGNGALLVYDHDGNGHVFLPDHIAGRHVPFNPHPEPVEGWIDDRALMELDAVLMKPSCCDAPDGLCHFWDLPKQIGTLPTALPGHPGQGARAADPGSPRGPIP